MKTVQRPREQSVLMKAGGQEEAIQEKETSCVGIYWEVVRFVKELYDELVKCS